MVNTENRAKTALGIPLRWADLIIDATFSDEKSGKAVLNAHSVVPIQLGPTGPQVPLEIIENDRCQCRRERRVWPVAPTSGIGTTSPDKLVTLSSANTNDTSMSLINTTTGGHEYILGSMGSAWSTPGTFLIFDSTVGGAAGQRLVISPAGNLGLGITNPQRLLEIDGNETGTIVGQGTKAALAIVNTNLAAYNQPAELQFYAGGVGTKYELGGISALYNQSDGTNGWGGDLAFFTKWYTNPAASERLRITNAGNVGIGTSNPTSTLQVVGTVAATSVNHADYGVFYNTQTSYPNGASTMLWANGAQASPNRVAVASGVFTITDPGTYFIKVRLNVDTAASGYFTICLITGGVTVQCSSANRSTWSAADDITGDYLITFTAGQTFYLQLNNTTGSTATFDASEVWSRVMILKAG